MFPSALFFSFYNSRTHHFIIVIMGIVRDKHQKLVGKSNDGFRLWNHGITTGSFVFFCVRVCVCGTVPCEHSAGPVNIMRGNCVSKSSVVKNDQKYAEFSSNPASLPLAVSLPRHQIWLAKMCMVTRVQLSTAHPRRNPGYYRLSSGWQMSLSRGGKRVKSRPSPLCRLNRQNLP